MDNPADLTIVGEKGTYGTLSVNLIPTDSVNKYKFRPEIKIWARKSNRVVKQ